MTTLLVVDDTESNRFILGSWLRRAGYEVLEAATGTEAMALVERQTIDLVVLDVNLPDMSGYEVCEWLKGRPETSAVPVIHASATAVELADRTAGLMRGADAYLIEPIERDEMLAQVTALLRYSTARRQVERLAGRLAMLHAATLEVHGANDISHLLLAVARGAAAITGGPVLVVTAVENRGLAVAGEPGWLGAVQPCGAAEAVAAADGSAVALDGLRAAGFPVPDDAEVVPIRSRGARVNGAVITGARSDEVTPVLAQLALSAAVAAENLRVLELEHRIGLTLQQSLLPEILPVVAGLRVAARYDASSEYIDVGGDFFEVLELGPGRIAIAVGDVQGHNLLAATVMAELRNALRAYLLEGHGPAAVLSRLNDLLLRFHPDLTATVTCGIVEDGRRLVLANAGHLPGVLASGGSARFVEVPGPLLGVQGDREEQTFDLLPGDVFALATDGLVERRSSGFTAGLVHLREVMSTNVDDIEVLSDRILAEVGPGREAEDDVALLVVQVTK